MIYTSINSLLHICQGKETNLGHYSNGKKFPSNTIRVVSKVRSALLAANVSNDRTLSITALRLVATAATAGLDDSTRQMLGLWKSFSYLLYVRLESHHLASVATRLMKCSSDIGCLKPYVNDKKFFALCHTYNM